MLCLCDLHVFLHVCLRLLIISDLETMPQITSGPDLQLKKMRTQISCNTTWKINLRNGFLGGFLHSYTFHSAERLCAVDSVVLNLLCFQFGPVISKALICQA